MHVTQTLPEGYSRILRLDLQRDRKLAVRVNLIGLAIMAAMAVGFHFIVPIRLFLGDERSAGSVALHMAVLFGGYTAYIVLHELTHAAVMKAFGATKLRFGFTGLYAFAGSEEDWFDRTTYLPVALAPLTVWGLIFLALQLIVPEDWAWIVWFMQIGNVAGSVGDLYVSIRFSRLPREILVRDTGVSMDVYAPGRTDEKED